MKKLEVTINAESVTVEGGYSDRVDVTLVGVDPDDMLETIDAKVADIKVRKDAQDIWFEADWLQEVLEQSSVLWDMQEETLKNISIGKIDV